MINGDTKKELRKYHRVNLRCPIISDMRILKINNNEVFSSKREVLVEDISGGGMKFLSILKFPSSESILLSFEAKILNYKVYVEGHPIWRNEVSKGIFQYGLEFKIQEQARSGLIGILNMLEVKMERNIQLPDCNFYKDNKIEFFNEQIELEKKKVATLANKLR